jgi:hypothetical protein
MAWFAARDQARARCHPAAFVKNGWASPADGGWFVIIADAAFPVVRS